MKTKLVGLLIVILLALVALIFRITYISIKSGDRYTRQVLTQSQQQYESTTVPFKRGDILDRNGNTLATSVKVYNVILDCSLVNSDKNIVNQQWMHYRITLELTAVWWKQSWMMNRQQIRSIKF